MRSIKVAACAAAVAGLFAWLGFPATLHALGLHPEYQGERHRMPGGRALIVTTSHRSLGESGKPTGVFGSEMTAPYYTFLDAGLTVDVASIAGGDIPIDPLSTRWFTISPWDKRFAQDPAFQTKVRQSLQIDDVDFTRYDIVFLAGGWGAAYDLGYSDVLGAKISEAWKAGKVIGGVCHGPLGLLRAKDRDGQPLVRGKHLSAVTDRQVEQLRILETPQHPERELRAAGALFEANTAFRDFFATHTVADGRLVTGQNQNSGVETAEQMIRIAQQGGKTK